MALNFFNIMLLFISFVAFAISSGFITDSSRRIGNLPEKSTNEDLQAAHKYSIWASIVGWISVALLVVAGILIVIYSAEIYESGFASWLVTGLLFFTLAGSAIVGVLAAITANDIEKSGVSQNNNSRRQAIIAAVLAIITFVAVLIAFFIKMFYKPKDKELEKLKKEAANVPDTGVVACSAWGTQRACENEGCGWLPGIGCTDQPL